MQASVVHEVLANAYTIEERNSGWWYLCKLCSVKAGYSNQSACRIFADRHVLHNHRVLP